MGVPRTLSPDVGDTSARTPGIVSTTSINNLPINKDTFLCGPPPAHGQYQRYPGRFLFNLKKYYPEFFSDNTLHMFSGSTEFGVTTDFREETGAKIIAPFDRIPMDDGAFDNVLADPPYASHWQGQWHGDLPRPKHILREAARLCKPGGLIGILHIIIIPAYKIYGVKRIGVHAIFAGPNNAIRALNVFRRDNSTPLEPSPLIRPETAG